MSGLTNSWIITTFNKGGIIMYPILFCSIIALAIILERLVALKYKKVINDNLLDRVRKNWLDGNIKEAIAVCNREELAMSRILKSGLMRSNYGLIEIERAIEGSGAHESAQLTANLRGLGVVSTIAPMLGLLGTVTGMISAFNVISTSGTGNPSLVASGISEALITTAAGLFVGIPSLAAYHYLKGKADRLIFEMEDISVNFIEELTQKEITPKRRDNEV